MKISRALEAFVQAEGNESIYWAERAKLDFAVSLEHRRQASKLTYKQVASALSASAAYVSKVFRGETNLTIESMVKLAQATGGSLEIRVVPKRTVADGWASCAFQPFVVQASPPVVVANAETVTETAIGNNVVWAAQLFNWNRAA